MLRTAVRSLPTMLIALLILLAALGWVGPAPQIAIASHCYSTAFKPVLNPAPTLRIRGRGTTTCSGATSGVVHETSIARWNGTFWSIEDQDQDSTAPFDVFSQVTCATTTSSQWRTAADSNHNGTDWSPAGIFYNCREA